MRTISIMRFFDFMRNAIFGTFKAFDRNVVWHYTSHIYFYTLNTVIGTYNCF